MAARKTTKKLPPSKGYCELLIGCGRDRKKRIWLADKERFTNLITLDINRDHKPDYVHDLTKLPLPFANNSFDEIHAYEVLEHTGQQGDYKFFFAQFNEFWRILKPDGVLIGTTPSPTSVWAWGDPSHTRIFPIPYLTFLSLAEYEKQVGVTAMSDFRYLMKCNFEVLHARDTGEQCEFVLHKLPCA